MKKEIFQPERCIVGGYEGGMGNMFFKAFKEQGYPTAGYDPLTIEYLQQRYATKNEEGGQFDLTVFNNTERLLRNMAAELLSFKGGEKIPQALLLSIPEEIFQALNETTNGTRSQIRELFGVPGNGQNQTVLMHTTSVQAHADQVLSPWSGPVIGAHQLHNAEVSDFSNRTVILGTNEEKQKHHLFEPAKEWVQGFFKKMGYQNIISMSVEGHDLMMSNIQFLTHSLFLVIADFVKKTSETEQYDPQKYPEWIQEILLMSQRILSGNMHVYKGIALSNPFNKGPLEKWSGTCGEIEGDTIEEIIRELVLKTGQVVDEQNRDLGISKKEKRIIVTPVSLVRDGIRENLEKLNLSVSPSKNSCTKVFRASLADYATMVAPETASPNSYATFFEELQEFFPDRTIEDSNHLLKKYN